LKDKPKKKIKWWKRKEVHALALGLVSLVPEIVKPVLTHAFPENTLLFQLATPIGMAFSLVWGALGLRDGYKSDNLPQGIRKVMDKIPDKITGERK